MRRIRSRPMLASLAAVLLVATAAGADVLRRAPSHDRVWTVEQQRLPRVEQVGERVRIENLRDFRHSADGPPQVAWVDAEYDLSTVESVWFVLSPFGTRKQGLAHPFLSFRFSDGRTLAVSVEARKEAHEQYSAFRGLWRRYETMIVLGTEQDLLGLRAIAWRDPLYLFPIGVPAEQARTLLQALLDRAAGIQERPEYYHTLWNNCTTNLIDPINRMTERRIGRLVGLLPGYSYEAAWRRGWIATDLPLEEARRAHRINDRVVRWIDDPDFSERIRTR